MKNIMFLTLFLIGVLAVSDGFAQDLHNQCTAAFIGSKMVVDEYTTKGQCRISKTASGDLAVFTVNLSTTESQPLNKINFRIAIRDKETKTLTMFSGKKYEQIAVQEVLAKCKQGDAIVLLTEESQYALPHNEILVQ